jgi:flagellar protein FlgJ
MIPITPPSLRVPLDNPGAARHADRLRPPTRTAGRSDLSQACSEFESLFLSHLMRQMRDTIPDSGLIGGKNTENLYASMLDGCRARELAEAGGLGLGKMLYEHLKRVT